VDNTPGDPTDFDFTPAIIRCNGGRGGSTYFDIAGDPPVPGTDAMNPDINAAIGNGNGGGGGAGGGVCMIAGGQIIFVSAEIYAHGKRGGNSSVTFTTIAVGLEDRPLIAGLIPFLNAGDGGGGILEFLDSDGFDSTEIGAPLGDNTQVQLAPDETRDLDEDGAPDLTIADIDILIDLLEMSGNVEIIHDIYGDDQKEIFFGVTRIVTEFFDTLSDSVSYDRVQILSNAPDFAYDTGDLSNNVMRMFVDVASTGPGGTPEIVGFEDTEGNLTNAGPVTGGVTNEIGAHFNSFPLGHPLNRDALTGGAMADFAVGADTSTPQYDSTFIIPAAGPELGRRFVRVRLVFDLTKLGSLSAVLASFAPGGILPTLDTIADDPLTPVGGPNILDNILGNIDQAPVGVPAYAEVRVRFTP
jgi:hypothetical protein